ncbi:MAG: bifunctional diaminohydroxyphosphoribosylaminopyrimidine deaminase/5-amino-6-(5-phosphoribosylamino)uracil reductase RibD [Betaproteobacteria bacterium]|nr:bifunctional diaminohydroxyphosphoribosylaminopyrimidine deaminase/5-amino-6-(5-phosphoribosylamino)uracil reductase RibD [Betaproteobacteria bacterium]
MSRALALGARGLDTATPNPSVGCVIAKGGRVIGEGWHARAGEPHAEAAALAACREDPTGATAYVTLEPCSHRGRTPPCADALVRAGLARVVAALEDPNPLVAGAGFRRLREAGLQVEAGLLAGEAALLHRAFLSRMSRGRPWMILKAGASLDGRTALASGESRWITSEEARRDVHRLRRRACAVLTGYGTVRADDPDLTVRHVPCERQPRRVVIDNRLELPEGARILQGVPPLVLTVSGDGAARERLESRGAEVLSVGAEGSKTDLVAVARMLAARGFNEVLVETGPKLAGSLLRAGLVDEIVLYLAPSLLGDLAQGLFALGELASLGERRNLAVTDVRAVGRDLRVIARLET